MLERMNQTNSGTKALQHKPAERQTILKEDPLQDRPFRDCILRLVEKGIIGEGIEYVSSIWEHKGVAWLYGLEAKEAGWTPDDARERIQEWALELCQPPVPVNKLSDLLSVVDSAYRLKGTGLVCMSVMFTGESHMRLGLPYAICHHCEGEHCSYHKWEQGQFQRAWLPIQQRFYRSGWADYLEQEYGPRGRLAVLCYRALIAKAESTRLWPGSTILIGYRKIPPIISRFDKSGGLAALDAKTISRAIRLLEDEKLLEISVRGKAGQGSRESNGYLISTSIPPLPCSGNEHASESSVSLSQSPTSDTHITHIMSLNMSDNEEGEE
ncbi:hypothetical protein ACFL44_03595 [Gemmatimonadota bacterium]